MIFINERDIYASFNYCKDAMLTKINIASSFFIVILRDIRDCACQFFLAAEGTTRLAVENQKYETRSFSKTPKLVNITLCWYKMISIYVLRIFH